MLVLVDINKFIPLKDSGNYICHYVNVQ